ncbi:MAG: DUF294 nucleotidyltransferase-like domain-containing protein [Pseudomonadota bacterium]
MKQSTGATPLSTFEAVSLDLETTGLDPANARIVQLGLVDISRGEMKPHSQWEQIVNPQMPMPEQSREIHGIDDEMTSRAPSLVESWDQLMDRLDKRIIVGHTIGFDLTVLENEASRHKLQWKKPRALCVKMLATIVAPGLADHSLDALATWLGVTIEDRHQALGDAKSTALVFLALQERLKQAGIHTLAEAERASLRLGSEIERHERAGWQLPVETPGANRVTMSGFDAAAYSTTLGDIMSKPPKVISGDTNLLDAMKLMAKSGISSVFVDDTGESGRKIQHYGILTERDVMRQIASKGEDAFSTRTGSIATKPVESVRESAFIYRALGRMTRLKYRHLAVRNDEDDLVGVVSARDLLKARTSPAVVLDDTIAGASSSMELESAWSTLPAVVNALTAENIASPTICRIISEEIRAMTSRASQLALDGMRDAGKGEPPCNFDVMVLGSGGRGESMLVPDQDNAIIFADGEPDGENDRWFAELGSRIADILDQSGIPYCKGGVMAKNDIWRGSTSVWKERIDGWVAKSSPRDLLNVDIFFDAISVFGDHQLSQNIFEYAYQRGHENVPFAKLLGESLSSIPDPFTLFGGLKADGNRLDLKMHVLFPVSATARTLAIRHNVARHSTRQRFEGLTEAGVGGEVDFANLMEAQELAFQQVLENQSRDIESGLKASNFIDLGKLDRVSKNELKDALRNVSIIPTTVRDLMFN